jgi:predicted dinucleotide-binding enzyme
MVPHAALTSNADATAGADVVLLTLPCPQSAAEVHKLAALLGDVRGKVVIDATNPLGCDMELRFQSAGEEWAAALPGAHVFKAFNTIGSAHMADPNFMGTVAPMFYAGPADSAVRAIAERVIADVGFRPVYVGCIRYARNLEAMAELWVHMAYVSKVHGGNNHFAFGFLEK